MGSLMGSGGRAQSTAEVPTSIESFWPLFKSFLSTGFSILPPHVCLNTRHIDLFFFPFAIFIFYFQIWTQFQKHGQRASMNELLVACAGRHGESLLQSFESTVYGLHLHCTVSVTNEIAYAMPREPSCLSSGTSTVYCMLTSL